MCDPKNNIKDIVNVKGKYSGSIRSLDDSKNIFSNINSQFTFNANSSQEK